jgi:Rieske Fe-S protein
MQTRRSFLQNSFDVLAGITVVGFVAADLVSIPETAAAQVDDAGKKSTINVNSLKENNTAIRSMTPTGRPIIIIRRSPSVYTTLLLICTHKGCSGDFLEMQESILKCQCHGSEYIFSGAVVKGPAKRNLTAFDTEFNSSNNTVTITF